MVHARTPDIRKNAKGTLGSYYAVADYKAFNPEFGTMDDFKAMVSKAHEMGFKVIIDCAQPYRMRQQMGCGTSRLVCAR